jgi:hypothetical protein
MFWKEYLRTAPYVQGLILLVVLGLYFSGHFLVTQIALVAIVMELAGFVGAAWSMRLKRKFNKDVSLPLR